MAKPNPIDHIKTKPAAKDIPAVLLSYQQKWIADKSQLKIGEKSRRIGLTWAEAADATLEAASDKSAGGQNTYYLGYNKDMTVEFIQACAMWAQVYNLAAGEVEEGIWQDGKDQIQTYIIRFPNSGFRIEALTSRPSNLRGRQGRVILDEAAFHDDLMELLKAALALLIWGGCVRVISTHNGDDNPFNELVKEIRSGKRKGSVHHTTFRDAVEQGLYQRVCMRKGIAYDPVEEQDWVQEVYDFYGDAADEELDVIPSKGGGRWLSQALLEQRQKPIPVVRLSAPKGFETWTEEARNTQVDQWCTDQLLPLLEVIPKRLTSYYGLDFARKRDACVMWPLLEQQDTTKTCPFVLELFAMPYKQQERLVSFVVARLPDFRKGAHDATGNGGYLAEAMQVRYGERIEAIMLNEGWYRENTPAFKAALEDGDLADLPKDKDIIDDHRAFRLVKGVARIPDGNTSTTGGHRHGDSGIAHLLGHYASRNPAAPIEWTPVPSRAELEADDGTSDFDSFTPSGMWS